MNRLAWLRRPIKFDVALIPELFRVSATLFAGSVTASALVYAIVLRFPADVTAGGWLPVLHALAYAALLLLVSTVVGFFALVSSKSTRKRRMGILFLIQVSTFLLGAVLLASGIFLVFASTAT